MLLLPFRATLKLVDKTELAERTDLDGPSIYYGVNPEGLPEDTLALGCVTSTMEYFDRSAPHPTVSRYVKVQDHRIPVLFEGSGGLSLDPVASVLYFLSAWQEIHSVSTDEHGRFPYEQSIQHSLGNADEPWVEWYRHIFADALRKKGATLESKEWAGKDWAFCPTHDIDYDRKWRPGIYKRELLDRVVLNKDREDPTPRLSRVTDVFQSFLNREDPFQTAFSRMQDEVKSRGGRATYFMKSGGKGRRDVPYSLTSPFIYPQLVQLRANGFEIGHHPSYHAFLHPERLIREKEKLETVCGFKILAHRAHYLRVSMPQSAHHVAESGFKVDSSLGFATQGGFRHATCLPFPLYDPVRQVELDVWEMPLTVMESSLFNRMNLTSAQASSYTDALMATVARFGGVFVGLWHNTLWDERDYPGWGKHFIDTIDAAKDGGATMDTLSKTLESWK